MAESVVSVLPAHVIDQIAAGEVVERPASVVKELVDNALDAGARTICVEAIRGGRELVRVSDDGSGMSAADAVLAFERHATSKLRTVEDLWGIASMGFRGEALPSIASVAKVVLTTRRAQDLAGTRVEIAGGRMLGVSEVGAAVGTTVAVSELFYNVPARQKFLKADATEASHLTDLMSRFALANPELHLRLMQGGRTALEAVPERDAMARIAALLGPRVATRLWSASSEEGGVRVRAYLGAPELAQTTSRAVHIFVGRRAVRDRHILHAIAMGYGELVPRGRYPVAVVLLDLPASAVDINVHPQKHEVRFADVQGVTAAVRHVVQAAIRQAGWRETSPHSWSLPSHIPVTTTTTAPALPLDAQPATELAVQYARALRDLHAPQATMALDGGGSSAPASRAGSAPARAWVKDVRRHTAHGRSADHRPGPHLPAPFTVPAVATTPVSSQFFSRLRFLGQVELSYLVCEGEGELVVIDQHAASECFEHSRLAAAVASDAVVIQKLLIPVTIDVSPALFDVAIGLRDDLARVGFDVEPFGKTTLAIKASPVTSRKVDEAELLRRVLTAWMPSDGSLAERQSYLLGAIACHGALRSGDRIDSGDAEPMLRALNACVRGPWLPHGQRLLARLGLADLARRFE